MKIIIFGVEGFLGKKLKEFLSKEHDVIGVGKHLKENFILDATNKKEVEKFIFSKNPDIVLDTIAISNSVICEKNPLLAKKINYLTAKNIAKASQKIGAKMIFFSSSYVFNGKKGDYSENDKLFPTNEYAKTKVMAEKEILNLKNYLIIRLDLMYGVHNGQLRFGSSIFEKEIKIGYPNQIKTPIFVEDIPPIISKLIKKNKKGIFHMGGIEKIKIKDFINYLAVLVGKESIVKEVDSSNWIVKSPANSSLNISKIKSLGINLTSFEKASKIIKNQLS